MATIDLGKIQPLWRGEFTPTPERNYEPLDYLKYQSVVYLAIQESNGLIPPTNTDYFTPFTDVDPNIISQTLIKSETLSVMFSTTGTTLTTNQEVVVKGRVIPASTPVSLPTLVDGVDYKVYLLLDNTLLAQLYESIPPANSKELGGFHTYHTTGGINANSIWDLNYRPSCSPRGMVISPDKLIWCDIYLTDVNYALNNYSQSGANIANETNKPIIPVTNGGDGVTTYSTFSWFNAWDIAINAGKRLPTWGEFTGLTYGVIEQQSVGSDPITTQYQVGHRSNIGLEQATGVFWVWGSDTNWSHTGLGVPLNITEDRGSVYGEDAFSEGFGGSYEIGSNSGSRSAFWWPTGTPNSTVSSRFVCNHISQ